MDLEWLEVLLTEEWLKNLFSAVAAVIGLLALVKGIIEIIHSNAIRRYEKFHEMSKRFDDDKTIQRVCALLHGDRSCTETLTRQNKEVFICFLEEIYFMRNSRIMKQDLALYTFGYYGKLALYNEDFWRGLNKSNPFYTHFLAFCRLAGSYKPESTTNRKKLAY